KALFTFLYFEEIRIQQPSFYSSHSSHRQITFRACLYAGPAANAFFRLVDQLLVFFFGKDRQSHIILHFVYLLMLFCACAAQQFIVMLNEHFIAIFTALYTLFLPDWNFYIYKFPGIHFFPCI